MPTQHGAAPIAMVLIMPNQIACCPIRCLRGVKRPILATGHMDPGINLEAPCHAPSACGHKHAARFLSAIGEIGAAPQIERIGVQPAFIQRDGGEQSFRQAVIDLRHAGGSEAGRAWRIHIAGERVWPLGYWGRHFGAGGAEKTKDKQKQCS